MAWVPPLRPSPTPRRCGARPRRAAPAAPLAAASRRRQPARTRRAPFTKRGTRYYEYTQSQSGRRDVARAHAQEEIKTHITDLMLSAPPRVRAQLREALSLISGHDFPGRWQGLLPYLIQKLSSDDLQLARTAAAGAAGAHRQRGRGARAAPQAWLGGVSAG